MNVIDIEHRKLFKKILEFDLKLFAKQLNLINYNIESLTNEDAACLINIAEEYSRHSENDKMKHQCISICGLLWEHRNTEWKALDSALIQIMTRLGLGPSAKMVDSQFENGRFSNLGSFVSELKVSSTLDSFEVEITPNIKLLLSSFQKNMWDNIDKVNRLGISAPTSAGKSFVLVYKIIDTILKTPGEIVYIVPTVSLVNQVSNDIRKALKEANINDFTVMQSYSSIMEDSNSKIIYVLTQERALSAFTQDERPFKYLKLLIIDEIQNIERTANEDDERAHILYDVLNDFINILNPEKIVISGPRLTNIDSLVNKLFGEGKGLSAELPPVVNITYSFAKENGKKYLKQYSNLSEKPIKLEIENMQNICGFGGSQYNDDLYCFISSILNNLENDSGTLIFSPTANQAAKTANEVISFLDQETKSFKREELNSLINYIENTVHPNYSLIDTIVHGVAYHHGKMPIHARQAVEQAFSERIIKTIACTTTLMQGVNLPAKNLIVRNPNLFIKRYGGESPKLTGYEFANLRGRAGRLMKDFVGRAIVLDENAFENSSDYLQTDAEKEVVAGYSERFNKNENEIISYLMQGQEPVNKTDFNDIAVYIRHTILKYDQNALKIMDRIGIRIGKNEFENIKSQLNKLKVPMQICLNNRYWDPLTLDKIYRISMKKLPSSPFDNDYVDIICNILNKLKYSAPYYYEKYFNVYDDSYIKSLIIYAQEWSKEVPLREILDNSIVRDHLNVNRIDDIIGNLTNKISFSVPKLLKPLVDMQDPQNPLLSFIELGAYFPITRKIIATGVPRETSITIRKIIGNLDGRILSLPVENINENILKNILRKVYSRLNYWEQKQIENIF